MIETQIIEYAKQAMMLVLLLSLPPIIAAAVVGTMVSLLQALTQIQEQTLSFAIKLIAVIVTLFLTMRWIGIELFHYAQNIFQSIGTL